jgi:hypothetical protein
MFTRRRSDDTPKNITTYGIDMNAKRRESTPANTRVCIDLSEPCSQGFKNSKTKSAGILDVRRCSGDASMGSNGFSQLLGPIKQSVSRSAPPTPQKNKP